MLPTYVDASIHRCSFSLLARYNTTYSWLYSICTMTVLLSVERENWTFCARQYGPSVGMDHTTYVYINLRTLAMVDTRITYRQL